ncbi:sterol homeostasis protein [Polyrhizophydium stewartii]|uniref:Protein ARV n=1 Tax=Polyrhizophydium stewartii TaxID=2732419 RepID=A0ABR4N4K1_9FUNG
MPVCIECGEPVPTLYVEYGKGNIRLQRCDKCQTFADRYLEFDYVIIFIDMLLHKRPVYRHLIFNRLQYSARGWNGGLIRLGVLLVLFEVFMKWFRLDRRNKAVAPDDVALHTQYLYMLSICAFETFLLHAGVRAAVALIYNQLSMSLVLSSFGKILLIVMVVWKFYEPDPSILVNILVFTSNIEALSVFLKTSIPKTFVILNAGMVLRMLGQLCIRQFDPHMEVVFV